MTHFATLELLDCKNRNGIKRRKSRFLHSLHFAASCLELYAEVVSVSKSRANTSGAYHVQHAVCYVMEWDSSAIKFGRAGIAFILAFFTG